MKKRLAFLSLALVSLIFMSYVWTAIAAEQVTVVMLEEKRTNYIAWQHEVAQRFMAANPDIKVEFIGRGGDPMQKIQTYLLAGQQLDIAWMDPWAVPVLARQGQLVNLTPYVQRDWEQFADWFPRSFDMLRVGGDIYGLARDLQLPGVFYNVEWFNERGVPFPSSNWTFDDLANAAKRLTKLVPSGEPTQWGFKFPTWRNWITLFWNFGGDFLDDWVEPTKFVGNSEGMRTAIRFLYELGQAKGMPGSDEANDAVGGIPASFVRGNVAMVQSNTFSLVSVRDNAGFPWDVLPLPKGPGEYSTSINGLCWFMLSSSPNKEAAWRVLKYFTSHEAQRLLVDISQTPPPSRSVIMGYWLPRLEVPASRAIFFEAVDRARPLGTIPDAIYAGFSPHVHAAVWGTLPIEEAIANMENDTTLAIREWNAGLLQQ